MNWFNKISSLNVTVQSANSYGDLTIDINGRQYNYIISHPFSATEIAGEISRSKGKKLSKLIRWLDSYRVK